MLEMIDTQPGHYYVSALRDTRTALVSGPYSTHTEALALVDRARDIANDKDPRTVFDAFGTCRIPLDALPEVPQGMLQKWDYSLNLEKTK